MILTWSSLEHLSAGQATKALEAFWRILRPGGVLLVTVPDTQAALSLLLEKGAQQAVYHLSADGSLPVTPLDLLFGDQRSISEGNRSAYWPNIDFVRLRDAFLFFSTAFRYHLQLDEA